MTKDEYIQMATEIINQGVDLMTGEQLGQWDGVRAWLELADIVDREHVDYAWLRKNAPDTYEAIRKLFVEPIIKASGKSENFTETAGPAGGEGRQMRTIQFKNQRIDMVPEILKLLRKRGIECILKSLLSGEHLPVSIGGEIKLMRLEGKWLFAEER